MSHSQQMVEALDQQELEEAEVQFQKALLEDSEAQLLDLGQYLESIGFYPQAKEVYEQIAETYPEVYLSLATILAEEGQTEEAFAYLEEIGPESNWYVASLLVKADLYQLEGLADVAREKLVEAASLSDDPIIQLGNWNATKRLSKSMPSWTIGRFWKRQGFLPINGLVLPMPILVGLKQLCPS